MEGNKLLIIYTQKQALLVSNDNYKKKFKKGGFILL